MYYEKPREYEEFEDICDVRGFEQAEDSGKFDCRICEDDISKTAFKTHECHYEFIVITGK